MAEIECLAHGEYSVHGWSCDHYSYLFVSLLFFFLSLTIPFSSSPFSSPSVPLWLSLHLRAMLAALNTGSCGQEPHLPLTRAGAPTRKTRGKASSPIFSCGDQGQLRPSLNLPTGPQELRPGVPVHISALSTSYPQPPHLLAMSPLTLGT